ncbi:hypothetical protein MPER_16294 [Moniliophthora perniciosa FA553]|nr:hypothetical protein MPER_16294 [Moniliophthora perniciosa FA553]
MVKKCFFDFSADLEPKKQFQLVTLKFITNLESDRNACAIICIKFGESLGEVAEVLKATEDLQKCWSSSLSLRCFYSVNTSSQKLDQATTDEDRWDCILNAIIV